MGMNIILSLIMGTLLTVIVGTTVVPNYINEMKISQVEEQNLSNQELIKAAIIEYIKQEAKLPKTIEQLKSKTLKDYPNSNLNDETYSFKIDKKTGTLKILTKLDNSDLKYFENGFKSKNRPKCTKIVNNICKDGEWENFYLLDKDLYALIKSILDYSDPEYLGEFTPENIGKKDEHLKNPPKDGDKDYIVTINPDNKFDIKIEEKVYNEADKKWEDNGVKTPNGGLGYEYNVKIKDEKVVCKYDLEDSTQANIFNNDVSDKEFFVVNENTGLGEFVWVAPDDVSAIQTKIFGGSSTSTRENANNIIGEGIKYTPNNICVSNVTNMEDMFWEASNFNQDLNRWDVSNVKNMAFMFLKALNFNNGDGIGGSNRPLNWNVSNVTNMSALFNSTDFNQVLNHWDVSNVTDMGTMFLNTKFNQPLDKWDVSNVIVMEQMFNNAIIFNQDISSWDVSNVTSMSQMFENAKEFNKPLNNWNVSNVIDMNYMFRDASKFDQALNDWNVSKVEGMKTMFQGATIFNQDISKWNVSNVTDMRYMFRDASKFDQDLSKWCVEKITSKPTNFDANTPTWNKTNRQPKWGVSCP